MKRRNLMTALMCIFCLAAGTMAVPVMAEETEGMTEAAEVTTEAETGEAAEAETEAPLVRPEYTALDYVTLGEYKGLYLTLDPIEVTDQEVQEEIRYNIQLAEMLEEYTEGEVQPGDIANIDYVGTLDGEAFDGGTSKGYDLEIGSGTFIDGFEDGLVGVAVGETVDLPLTFPEYYGSEELAGQDVIFTVTVNSIKRVPELTDELVNELTEGEYTDVASYENSIYDSLFATAEANRENEIKNELFTLIYNNSETHDYPQEMVDYNVASMKSFYASYAEMYGVEYSDFLESFLGMTEEEFEEEAIAAVKQSLQQEMYLKAIAETEGMEVSDEDFAEGCEEMAAQYGYESGEDIIAAYGEDTLRASILQNMVMDLVYENAIVEEIVETELETDTEEVTEAETEA